MIELIQKLANMTSWYCKLHGGILGEEEGDSQNLTFLLPNKKEKINDYKKIPLK